MDTMPATRKCAGDVGPAGVASPEASSAGPVLSFLGPASALLVALQQDGPLASMSQADKDALNLAAIFCGRLATRMEQLGITVGDGELGPCHRPRVQPSTAAQLWVPSGAGKHGDAVDSAAGEGLQRILQPLKRGPFHPSHDTDGSTISCHPCLLICLPSEILHSICTPSSPVRADSLSLLARTCTLFGKAAVKGGLSLSSQCAQAYCWTLGVRRLPLTMGDGWCYPRMLSWLSQAVRVGAQCELKTIRAGVEFAAERQCAVDDADGDLLEGSVLVLVEPGVYEEQRVRVVDGQRVSIWRCDRGGESNKEEMQKVEWQSIDAGTLSVYGHASVSVSGMHMAAMKSKSGYDSVGCGFNCVCASAGGTLSLELCDLTCEDAAIAGFVGITSSAVVVRCRIHNGNEGGVLICGGASATLENNTIFSNTLAGVQVRDEGSEGFLYCNRIFDGKETGVFICDGAHASMNKNIIHSNGLSNVYVSGEGTRAIIRANIVHDGKERGVVIQCQANAVLDRNIIHPNTFEVFGWHFCPRCRQ